MPELQTDIGTVVGEIVEAIQPPTHELHDVSTNCNFGT